MAQPNFEVIVDAIAIINQQLGLFPNMLGPGLAEGIQQIHAQIAEIHVQNAEILQNIQQINERLALV
jgi:hypothetical protein